MNEMTMSLINSIQKLMQTKPIDSIEELHLDDFPLNDLPESLLTEIEKCQNLLIFSLNDCQIETIERLPNLPKLIRLELQGNNFKIEDLKALLIYKETLLSLSLANNSSIASFEDILILAQILPFLKQLDLYGCPIESSPNYREEMFTVFTKLEFLDNLNQIGNDVAIDYNEDYFESFPEKKIKKT